MAPKDEKLSCPNALGISGSNIGALKITHPIHRKVDTVFLVPGATITWRLDLNL